MNNPLEKPSHPLRTPAARRQSEVFSMPTVMVSHWIQTGYAQHIVKRSYIQYRKDMFALDFQANIEGMEVVGRSIGLMLKSFQQTHLDELANEEGRYQHEMDRYGITENARFPDAANTEFLVTSPRCYDYIELIQAVDRTLACMQTLWLAPGSEIMPEGVHKTGMYWQYRVLAFTRDVNYYCNRIRRYKQRLREKKAKRDLPTPTVFLFVEGDRIPLFRTLDDKVRAEIEREVKAAKFVDVQGSQLSLRPIKDRKKPGAVQAEPGRKEETKSGSKRRQKRTKHQLSAVQERSETEEAVEQSDSSATVAASS